MTNGSPNLVTGASGFVGAAVVRRLLEKGEAVRVLMRPGSDRRNIAGLDVDVVEGDLLAPETLTPAVQGCRALYHVAADYRIWTRDPAAMFRANVDGSAAIISAKAAAPPSPITLRERSSFLSGGSGSICLRLAVKQASYNAPANAAAPAAHIRFADKSTSVSDLFTRIASLM